MDWQVSTSPERRLDWHNWLLYWTPSGPGLVDEASTGLTLSPQLDRSDHCNLQVWAINMGQARAQQSRSGSASSIRLVA